jgi:hypothetical protein
MPTTKIEHISDDDYVLRRIYTEVHTDGILDSTAFDDRFDRPSVHLEKQGNLENICKSFPGFDFFIRLRVGDLRSHGYDVVHEPDEENNDDSHCVIVPLDGKWTRGKKRSLAGKGMNPIPWERVDLPAEEVITE